MATRTRVIDVDKDAVALAERAATLEHTDVRAFIQGLIASQTAYIRTLAFCYAGNTHRYGAGAHGNPRGTSDSAWPRVREPGRSAGLPPCMGRAQTAWIV